MFNCYKCVIMKKLIQRKLIKQKYKINAKNVALGFQYLPKIWINIG